MRINKIGNFEQLEKYCRQNNIKAIVNQYGFLPKKQEDILDSDYDIDIVENIDFRKLKGWRLTNKVMQQYIYEKCSLSQGMYRRIECENRGTTENKIIILKTLKQLFDFDFYKEEQGLT